MAKFVPRKKKPSAGVSATRKPKKCKIDVICKVIDLQALTNKPNSAWKANSYKGLNWLLVMIGLVHMVVGSISLINVVKAEAGPIGKNAAVNYCQQTFINFQLYSDAMFDITFGAVLIAFIRASTYKRKLLEKFGIVFLVIGICYSFSNFVYSFFIGCEVSSSHFGFNFRCMFYHMELLFIIGYILLIKSKNVNLNKIGQMEKDLGQVLAEEMMKQLKINFKTKPRVQKSKMEMQNEKEGTAQEV